MEKYITIEQLESSFRLVESKFDDRESAVEISKIEERGDFESFEEPRMKADRVVLSLGSEHSSTVERVLNVERSNPKEEITEGELDRIVFKCLWEFLNEYRSWSFKKLGVTDLDLILAGIDIFNVSLDSKKVLNPTGFKAEEISISLRGSFIPRDLLPLVEHFSTFGEEFRVVEGLAVSSSFVDGDADYIIHCGKEKTCAFAFDEEETKFEDKYEFGLSGLIDSVADPLGLTSEEATQIILRHLDDSLSTRMDEFVEESLNPHLNLLDEIIDDLGGKNVDIKVSMPEKIYDYTISGKAGVERVDYLELLESRGFNIINSKEDGSDIIDNPDYLPLITYPLFGDHYKDLNKILTRRSKWLVPEK